MFQEVRKNILSNSVFLKKKQLLDYSDWFYAGLDFPLAFGGSLDPTSTTCKVRIHHGWG